MAASLSRHDRAAKLAQLFKQNPVAYSKAALAVARQGNLHGLGDVLTDAQATDSVISATNAAVDNQTWYEKILSKLADIAPSALQTYVAVKSQDQLNQINIARAQHGLPPLDSSVVGTSVNVGLSQQTLQYATWGAIGLFALLALMLLRKR